MNSYLKKMAPITNLVESPPLNRVAEEIAT